VEQRYHAVMEVVSDVIPVVHVAERYEVPGTSFSGRGFDGVSAAGACGPAASPPRTWIAVSA
jgi:hypothetical protein